MDIIKKISPYHNEKRAQVLVIHAMAVSEDEAQKTLEGKSEYEVSCHYALAPSGQIYQYVDETRRAWHAGVSFWRGFTDVNSLSIGIEVLTPHVSHDFDKVEFREQQMDVLVQLTQDIVERNRIKPENVVAHQDIAPGRKFDPGPNFNWKYLADKGVGLWHGLSDAEMSDTSPVDEKDQQICLALLRRYGYDLRIPSPEHVEKVVAAFQTHFLPQQISGKITGGTLKAIQSLYEKQS